MALPNRDEMRIGNAASAHRRTPMAADSPACSALITSVYSNRDDSHRRTSTRRERNRGDNSRRRNFIFVREAHLHLLVLRNNVSEANSDARKPSTRSVYYILNVQRHNALSITGRHAQ